MRLVLIATLAAGAAAHEFSVDQNLVNLLVAMGTTVATVVAVLRFLDKKIDHKINNYANLAYAEFELLRMEISNLRELLGHPPLPKREPREKGAA